MILYYNLSDEEYFPSLLATGDGIEAMGEVTTIKVRNGMSFVLLINLLIIINNIVIITIKIFFFYKKKKLLILQVENFTLGSV